TFITFFLLLLSLFASLYTVTPHSFSLHWLSGNFSRSPRKQWSLWYDCVWLLFYLIQKIWVQTSFFFGLTFIIFLVQLDLPQSIRVKGGNLVAQYKALQLHLHWGKDGGPGSEHTIDGEQFPMEMHIVHIKEEYASLSQALKDSAGVAVLGFFFQVSKSANKKFDPFINALKHITRPTNSTLLTAVSLEMLTPPQKNMTKYFRYDGSLTTPNCTEAVVCCKKNCDCALAAFSQLQFPSGEAMVKTSRPVQPLNGRQVYYSGGHVALVSSAALIMSVLLSSALSLHTAA
uniref:Carbonic anhydrase n=1 Tax=Mola mola TaxID=94237 RepID=A0A3Q3WUK5_MOLML